MSRARRHEPDASTSPPRTGAGLWLLAVSCTGLVAAGWWIRDEGYLRAGEGTGYRLGIAGSAMMMALLLYSVRKRTRILGSRIPLRIWFRVHMLLGLAGPIAILFHSNFRLGSLNSSVALISMLLVAGSGIVGRVVYAKLHYGLYGRRVRLHERRAELTETRGKLRPLLEAFPEVTELLDAFEARHTHASRTAIGAVWRLSTVGWRERGLRRRCDALLGPVLDEERRATRDLLRRLGVLAEFSAWERLFRLWHAVHLPLFAMMILSLLVHVVAVHMY